MSDSANVFQRIHAAFEQAEPKLVEVRERQAARMEPAVTALAQLGASVATHMSDTLTAIAERQAQARADLVACLERVARLPPALTRHENPPDVGA
ncbi:hypothetical protein [Myxococcus sp. CA018]|nr:hypothetical protein [Myxococcus sp. CA018]NOK05814.1 hypothetical protein [Myxococcus xanthus]